MQVDLVIQILNATQPFTLGEQETLRQWLADRGIKTVVFVINWMNKLETKENRDEVYNEVRLITDSFQSILPKSIKNLYCVDALPALRAKQHQNILDVNKSGLTSFEAALYTTILLQKEEIYKTRLPRVTAIATQIKPVLQAKIQLISTELKTAEDIRKSIIEKGKKKEQSLKEGFKSSVAVFRDWLSLQTLLDCYQYSAANALKNYKFHDWKDNNLRSSLDSYIKIIEERVRRVCEEFQKNKPNILYIPLLSKPNVSLPKRKERSFGESFGDIFNGGANQRRLDSEYEKEKWQAYKNAAYNYLSEFSKKSLNILSQYESIVEPLISFPIPSESDEIVSKRDYLKSLNSGLEEIEKLENLENEVDIYNFNILQQLKTYLIFYKNYLFLFCSLYKAKIWNKIMSFISD